jgi:hypothetical protein
MLGRRREVYEIQLWEYLSSETCVSRLQISAACNTTTLLYVRVWPTVPFKFIIFPEDWLLTSFVPSPVFLSVRFNN